MLRWLLTRFITSAITVILATVVIFWGMQLLPGDPVEALYAGSRNVTPAQYAAIRHHYGLDRPVYVQYFVYIWHALHGDLGKSIATNQSVTPLILTRLPVTLILASASIIYALVIGVIFGSIAAVRARKTLDHVISSVSLLSISIPGFWLGLVLIIVFGLSLGWLPTSGYVPLGQGFGQWFAGLILPVIALGSASAGVLVRQMRISMLESLTSDFIRTARSKGLGKARVIFVHAARNSLTSVLTISGLQLGMLISGAVVIEEVFAIPGIGTLLLSSVSQRDYSVTISVSLIIAIAYVTINFVVDMLYGIVDPRVRVRGGSS